MEFDIHSVLAYTTIKTIVSLTGTTYVITVPTGKGVRFSPNQQVLFCPASTQPTHENAMIARLTAVSGDQLTIDFSEANREGTNERAIQLGDQIANIVTPKIFKDIEEAATTALAIAIAL